MKQERNSINFLDLLTILSFIVGLYALDIALKNLEENREQTNDTQKILDDLENHLRNQDLHLASQDRVLENITK